MSVNYKLPRCERLCFAMCLHVVSPVLSSWHRRQGTQWSVLSGSCDGQDPVNGLMISLREVWWEFDTIVTSPVGKMSSADWVMMSRHKIYRVIESLLVTNLTNNLLSFIACLGSLDSLTVTSVIVFPILQLGNKHEDWLLSVKYA